MQFIIVAGEDVTSLGRKLAHALSVEEAHEAALWSTKHYEDNEAQLTGKQAVVFLGDSEVAKSYSEFLPQRFSGFGTRCLYEGARAVLLAEVPGQVSTEDITRLADAVEGKQEEFRQIAEETEGPAGNAEAAGVLADVVGAALPAVGTVAARAAGGAVVGGAALAGTGVAVGLTLVPALGLGGALGVLIGKLVARQKRKKAYRKLQYAYVVSRFLSDEFDSYVAGIEGS